MNFPSPFSELRSPLELPLKCDSLAVKQFAKIKLSGIGGSGEAICPNLSDKLVPPGNSFGQRALPIRIEAETKASVPHLFTYKNPVGRKVDEFPAAIGAPHPVYPAPYYHGYIICQFQQPGMPALPFQALFGHLRPKKTQKQKQNQVGEQGDVMYDRSGSSAMQKFSTDPDGTRRKQEK